MPLHLASSLSSHAVNLWLLLYVNNQIVVILSVTLLGVINILARKPHPIMQGKIYADGLLLPNCNDSSLAYSLLSLCLMP